MKKYKKSIDLFANIIYYINVKRKNLCLKGKDDVKWEK